MSTKRRVAITGVGVVSSCGIGTEAFWNGLLSAAPEGLRRIENFDPEPYFANPKEARRTDRFAQFALAAADEAMTMAGDVGGDLEFEGGNVGKPLFAPEFLEEDYFEFLSVDVAVEIEEVDFEDALVAAAVKRGAATEIDDAGHSFAAGHADAGEVDAIGREGFVMRI